MWTVAYAILLLLSELRVETRLSVFEALCGPVAKSIYTEQNYYNTATQHENSKSSNSELLFELWYFCRPISINYSSSISRLLAHNAWHSVQQSLHGLCMGPLFVGPLFDRTCWTCLNPPLCILLYMWFIFTEAHIWRWTWIFLLYFFTKQKLNFSNCVRFWTT